MSSNDKIRPTKSKDELPSTSANNPLPLSSLAPASLPSTSKDPGPTEIPPAEPPPKPWRTRCWNYIYNKEKKLYCNRTCRSWWYMIIYSIMYLIFLSTYTMVFLYATLSIIKMTDIYIEVDKGGLHTYKENGIGLSATPTSLHSFPLISYTDGQPEGFDKYVKALDDLLMKRRKREVSETADLGPCASAPYGYGREPCVIIRLNKQMGWTAKPMNTSKGNLPNDLKDWLKLKEQKLWLHCDGYYPYDKEHIRRIKYYPHPPGFDPSVFPLDMSKESPLIAIQISNFTLGISLAVECKLWYDSGVSSVVFLLYVEPKWKSIVLD